LSEARKKQVARDFESVFISKLLDQMKDTIGDWGFERDGASQQIHGIFWLYLARDVANKGGFGLWKDIYNLLTASDGTGRIDSSG
jgi:Rod binding domain-containing protein